MNIKLKPNFTQIPNVFFDEIYTKLGYAELKVFLYVLRRTYGFHKKTDKISLTQFENGIEGLDSGTGLARKSIYHALELLVEKKLVIINKTGRINSYSLYLDSDLSLGTQSTQTRYVKYPKVGTQSNPQKKEKESIQNKDSESELSQDISLIIKEFEKVNPACKSMYGNTTQRKNCKELIETYSLEKVLQVINLLPKTNQLSFIPTITTPLQLNQKWAQLEIGLIRLKAEKQINNNKVAFI